jgi:hypothetical protein
MDPDATTTPGLIVLYGAAGGTDQRGAEAGRGDPQDDAGA